jgi:hypothetical protein
MQGVRILSSNYLQVFLFEKRAMEFFEKHLILKYFWLKTDIL